LPGAPPKAEAPAKSDAPVSDGTTPFGQAVAPNGADSGDADAGRLGSDTKEQAMSWFQEHTLGVITGVLALLVLIIAWALRRANASRDDDGDGNNGLITEAMVKAKLDKINLDLRQPPADGSPEKASGRTDDHTGEPPSEEPATNKP
jgi:pilus assembly protein FimV